jgi:lipoate---protein ligase
VEAVSFVGMVSGQSAQIHVISGSAGEFHRRDLDFVDEIGIWVCEVTAPAVVLGSRQGPEIVDTERTREAGFEIVSRRSGGTLVHLIPGEVVWVDVLVPAGHRHFIADLRASMIWMGEQWAAVLRQLCAQHELDTGAFSGVLPQISVYGGPVQVTPWADLVCFGGLGPGEVTVNGAKLVGISQRRTRAGARFQMAVHKKFQIDDLASLWALPTPDPEMLPEVATLDACGPISDRDLVDLLAQQLR